MNFSRSLLLAVVLFSNTAMPAIAITQANSDEPLFGQQNEQLQSIFSNLEIASIIFNPYFHLSGDRKKPIIELVMAKKGELELCSDTLEFSSENLDFSEVYIHELSKNILVKVLCWKASDHEVYEFIQGGEGFNRAVRDQKPLDEVDLELRHTSIQLVGLHDFDTRTGIISNSYKFNVTDSCIEETQHYWNGYQLQLASTEFIDGIEGGCDELGLRSPSEDFVITEDGVGKAKLGMTFGEFLEAMPEDITVIPAVLGIDRPHGVRISRFGEVQYDLGFDTEPITEDSQINLIAIHNPSYRTPEGIGPTTPLDTAIAQYGPATLTYTEEGELQETITFTKNVLPEKSVTIIQFRSNHWVFNRFVGFYPLIISAPNHPTSDYQPYAAIGSIWLMQ